MTILSQKITSNPKQHIGCSTDAAFPSHCSFIFQQSLDHSDRVRTPTPHPIVSYPKVNLELPAAGKVGVLWIRNQGRTLLL